MKFAAIVAVVLLLASAACSSETAEELSPTPAESPTPTASPTVTPTPTPAATLSIDGPTEVGEGSEFAVRVAVTPVTDLVVFQFDLAYDRAVIEVAGEQGSASGVSGGAIDDTPTSIDWAFVPSGEQGRLRVLGETPGISGASGSGHLAEVHFRVVGEAAESSDLTLSDSQLIDAASAEIAPVAVEHGSVAVGTLSPTPTSNGDQDQDDLLRPYETGDRQFTRYEVDDKIVYWHQRSIDGAMVEGDYIRYIFDGNTGELLDKTVRWRDDLPEQLPPVISKDEAEALVEGEVRSSTLCFISPESAIYPIEPPPENPCWTVSSITDGKVIFTVVDAVEGKILGFGLGPPSSEAPPLS
jgi:hypothetical protein